MDHIDGINAEELEDIQDTHKAFASSAHFYRFPTDDKTHPTATLRPHREQMATDKTTCHSEQIERKHALQGIQDKDNSEEFKASTKTQKAQARAATADASAAAVEQAGGGVLRVRGQPQERGEALVSTTATP